MTSNVTEPFEFVKTSHKLIDFDKSEKIFLVQEDVELLANADKSQLGA